MLSYSTQHIAAHVGGELLGPGDLNITGVEQLSIAQPGQISFIGDARYLPAWENSSASAALISRNVSHKPVEGKAVIVVDNADMALAKVLELFAPPPATATLPDQGVHPAAQIDATATIGPGACIGANTVVGPRATIGSNTVLHANVTVMDDCHIGEGCVLYPGTVIRERCRLGDRCILHPNVTIGSDGFGYRPSADGKGVVKIPQIGTVQIGNDVEIGSGSCVDRGKFSATVIGDSCKIDNLCQIGHNCQLGRCVIIAGLTGLAGSVTLGDGVMMGGHVSVRDHLTIGAGARIAGCAAVMDNVPAGETWGGYPAQEMRRCLREVAAVRKLPDLIKTLKSR